MNNFWTGVVHGVAYAIILAGSAFLLQAPAEWQLVTLGSIVGGLIKWAHLAYNS